MLEAPLLIGRWPSAAPLAFSKAVLVILSLAACGGERVHLGDGALVGQTVTADDAASDATSSDDGQPVPTDDGAPEVTTPDDSASNETDDIADEASSDDGVFDASTPPSDFAEGGSQSPGDAADGAANSMDASAPIEAAPSPESGAECVQGAISAEQVLWIGDSWLTIPGNQQSEVEQAARQAGVLGAGEQYVSLAAPAAGLDAIIGQYESRRTSATPPRVLIMDGGTWDTILENGSESSVTRVVSTFEAWLGDVEAHATVEHIIYMLPPELPRIPGVAALRPGLVAACEGSSVPCHFLDLQEHWEGHPEYTAPDGIQASQQGGAVIAAQIWSIMQDNCIAQ